MEMSEKAKRYCISSVITVFFLCLANAVLSGVELLRSGFLDSPAASFLAAPEILGVLNLCVLLAAGAVWWKCRALCETGFSLRIGLYTAALGAVLHFFLLLPAFENGFLHNDIQYDYGKYLSLFQDVPGLMHELFYPAVLAAGIPVFLVMDAKPLFRSVISASRKKPKLAVFCCSVLFFLLAEGTVWVCGFFSGQIMMLPIPAGRMTVPILPVDSPAAYRAQAVCMAAVQLLALLLLAWGFCAVVCRVWQSGRKERILRQTRALPLAAVLLWVLETAVICAYLMPGTLEAVDRLFLLYTLFPAINAMVLFCVYLLVKQRFAREGKASFAVSAEKSYR